MDLGRKVAREGARAVEVAKEGVAAAAVALCGRFLAPPPPQLQVPPSQPPPSHPIPLVEMWIFRFSLAVCSMEPRNLVSSLEYLVSNERQVLLGGLRLGGSATPVMMYKMDHHVNV